MTREDLIETFCDDCENRPTYNKPFIQGTNLCATDGHAALIIPEADSDFMFYSHQDKPSFADYLKAKTVPYMEFDTKTLKDAYWKLKDKVDAIDTRCPECLGKKIVEYSYWDRNNDLYTKDEECPVCEGTGERDITDDFHKKRYQFVLDDKYSLTFHALRKILDVADFFKLEKVSLLCEDSAMTQPFHIVDERFHMIVAPALYDHDEDEDEED